MTPRTRAVTRRAATTAGGALTMLLAAGSPARADAFYEPKDPGFGTLDALLLFVGVPLLVIAVVSLLVYAPSLAGRRRYRPGRPFEADPLLVDGGPTAAPALPPVAAEQARAGGASAGW